MIPRLSLADAGWYHSFELPDGSLIEGTQPLAHLRRRWDKLGLEDDLRGKRALDIGTWDGWFAFELERRGAAVTALDSAACEGFDVVSRALGSRVERKLMSVYELDPAEIGRFDIVLFQGVLYHLKHPLLALEKVCSVADGLVFVESHVSGRPEEPARLEFYERRELRGQFDNWCGPNVECLLAFCRTAGLVELTLSDLEADRALVEGRRQWLPPAEPPTLPAPVLLAVTAATTHQERIYLQSDEYAALYFRCRASQLNEDEVFPTFGCLAASVTEVCSTSGDGWTAVCRVPPGLAAGATDVTIRTKRTAPSNVLTVPVLGPSPSEPNQPRQPSAPSVESISIEAVADGKTWERNVLSCPERCLSLWVRGLNDTVRAKDLRVTVGSESAEVLFLSGRDPDGRRQINLSAPLDAPVGSTTVRIQCGGATSPSARLDIR